MTMLQSFNMHTSCQRIYVQGDCGLAVYLPSAFKTFIADKWYMYNTHPHMDFSNIEIDILVHVYVKKTIKLIFLRVIISKYILYLYICA